MSAEPSDLVADLRGRLLRYPADRFPAQHAEVQVHLGAALLRAGDHAGAERALRVAIATYDPELQVERARAANLLGAALRDAGRPAAAADAFAAAAAAFAEADLPMEEAAALHNLGLTLRDRGDATAAVGRFAAAREAFESGGAWAQAAAAAREQAAALLEAGSPDAAAAAARAAVDRGDRAGDLPGIAAAWNVAGLADLAGDRPAQAADAFSRSAAASPRRVRPEAYAMAKANLALACEALDDAPRARLAAGQALGAPVVPPPVGAQAMQVVTRLGEDPTDLRSVLTGTPLEGWQAVLGEEIAWWGDAPPGERRRRVEGLVDLLDSAERVEVWLHVLTELPPDRMEAQVRSLLTALWDRPPADRERLRGLLDRALPRFPLPQWQRMAGALSAVAAELGAEPGWV